MTRPESFTKQGAGTQSPVRARESISDVGVSQEGRLRVSRWKEPLEQRCGICMWEMQSAEVLEEQQACDGKCGET